MVLKLYAFILPALIARHSLFAYICDAESRVQFTNDCCFQTVSQSASICNEAWFAASCNSKHLLQQQLLCDEQSQELTLFNVMLKMCERDLYYYVRCRLNIFPRK